MMAANLPSPTTAEPEKQITCAICLQHYSDPRLLPCLHTYCRHCLQDLLAKGQRKNAVVCPECREEVQIISGDVTKLKVNFWINSLMSLLAVQRTQGKHSDPKTELTCENCDMQETATRRCTNCCMFLCDFCSTAHQRSVATKGHQLVTMDEMKNTGIPVIEKQLYCTKHKGEVKKLFCNTCQELICRDCTIIDHRNHQFNFLEDIADQHKQLFKKEVEKARSIKNKIEAVLKSVQKMKEKVEKTSKTTEKDVDKLIDKQIRALEEKRASLKEKTRQIAGRKIKELASQEDGLETQLTGLINAIGFTEKVVQNGGNSDILAVSKEVTSRLSQLCERKFNEKPRVQYSMRIRNQDKEISKDWIEKHVSVVDANEPDPKQCLVTQSINGRVVPNQGPITAAHGQVLKFVISISNAFGDKLRFMEDRIEVTACPYPRASNPELIFETAPQEVVFGLWRQPYGNMGLFDDRNPTDDPMFAMQGITTAQPTQTTFTSIGTGLYDQPTQALQPPVTAEGGIFSTTLAAPPQTSEFGVSGSSLQPRSNTDVTTQIRDIQCHEDNTYSFDFCLDQNMSKAEINVTVDGVQLQGCPFPITHNVVGYTCALPFPLEVPFVEKQDLQNDY